MRAFTIKHKGKTHALNIVTESSFTIGEKQRIYTGLLFFRKKDARAYLETYGEVKEFFEVVGMTIDKCDQDNRKKT
jgi:hypothetical protein